MSREDLAFYSDADLLHELGSRFECFVVAGYKQMTANGGQMTHWVKGDNDLAAIGLCSHLQARLNLMVLNKVTYAEDISRDPPPSPEDT